MDKADNDELVTVATFGEPLDAHLCCNWLGAEGIEAAIIDEHIAGLNWLYTAATGGAKVQVRRGQAERARALLRERQGQRQGEALAQGPACPDCDSEHVDRVTDPGRVVLYVVLAILAVILLLSGAWVLCALPLLVWCMLAWVWQRKRWRCRECGYEWTARRRGFPR